MNFTPLVNWFTRNGNFRVWFWFVGVIGLLPIVFRLFRYDTMLDVFGTGELLIVSTLVCGAAVDRSLSRLGMALRPVSPLPLDPMQRAVLQECMVVSIVVMIFSCAWYGYIESRDNPSSQVVWPSITTWVVAYALAGIVVWLDDSR
jgi:hypothetical protein